MPPFPAQTVSTAKDARPLRPEDKYPPSQDKQKDRSIPNLNKNTQVFTRVGGGEKRLTNPKTRIVLKRSFMIEGPQHLNNDLAELFGVRLRQHSTIKSSVRALQTCVRSVRKVADAAAAAADAAGKI